MPSQPSESLVRIGLAAALVLCLALCLFAAPISAQRDRFSDTTDVVVVEVPITVTDNSGMPLRGLTADNFEIKFDGDEQQIRSIEMIDLGPPTSGPIDQPPVTPPIPARRHFLVLFDLANSDPSSIIKAREAGRDLVRSLHPSDLIGVALYDNIQGVRFILSFTTDRRQVDVAIESLGVPGLFNPVADPLLLYLGEGTGAQAPQVPPPGSDDGGGRAGGFGAEADQAIRELVTAASKLDRFEQEERVERLTESFQVMAKSLAAIEGQKYVVYMSEGFDSSLLLGSGLDTQTTSSAIESGEIWNVDAKDRYGDTGLQNDMERMMESLRRAGTVVQSVDIGGLRAGNNVGGRPSGTDALNSIAQDTGGQLYDNFNDLGDAMSNMLEATSVTYLATFQPKSLPMDGKYRKLKVKLKNGPRGARVSHRAGFYAPTSFQETQSFEKQLSSAQLILDDKDTGSIDLDVLAPTIPVAGQKAYVPLLIEMDGPSLMLVTGNKQRVQMQLFTYAFDRDGNIHDFFTEGIAMDLSQVGQSLQNGGLKYWAHVDLEPGDYRVRVLIRDLASGQWGVRSAAVRVDPRGSSLLPAMVADTPGAWTMARESVNRQREVPFPFLLGGAPFIPSAKPTLPKSGKTDIILQMYGVEASNVSARVEDLDGNPVGEAEIKPGKMEAAGSGAVGQATLRTKGLDAGIYDLVLSAPGGIDSRIRVEVQ